MSFKLTKIVSEMLSRLTGFDVKVITLTPEQRIELHKNNGVKIFAVQKGTCNFLKESGTNEKIMAGQVLVIPAEVWHGFKATGEECRITLFAEAGCIATWQDDTAPSPEVEEIRLVKDESAT